MICARIALGCSAVKGKRPVSARYRITPRDQTSLRPSMSFSQRTCSGLMYLGEPRNSPVLVLSPTLAEASFAMPKSSTLTISSSSVRARNRLLGFRSR
jgi:hypothetical protein